MTREGGEAKGRSRKTGSRGGENGNAMPIENVVFKSSGGGGNNNNIGGGHDRHGSLGSFGDKDLGHAKQQMSSGGGNSKSNSPWTAPPSATAQAAAAAASYEYQQQQAQQQAYYAQQFYMQQQQQNSMPWPAPPAGGAAGAGGVSHPFFTPQQQRQMQQMQPPRSNGSIKATLSQGSDQDDEYAALLQKTLGGYGGYGSTAPNSNPPRGGNTGRVSPAGSNGSSISNSKRSNSGGPPPPPQNVARPKHRRAQSDSFYNNQDQQQNQQHPLMRSNSKTKPPKAVTKSPRVPAKTPGTNKPKHHRSRSLSSGHGHGSGTIDGSGALIGGLPTTLMKRPTHRRSMSNASSAACSVASEASFMSIKSDIRKSSFYGGVDKDTGETQLHYPNEHIYVCAVDDHPSLKVGKVYKLAVDDEEYEEYHRQAEDAMWEDDLEFQSNPKSNGRRNKDPFGALPSNQFALAVDPTVYRRVLSEISQAQQMPCGLFFCGHHEDVDRPSVGIATVLVTALFLSLGYWAYAVELS